MIFCQPFLALGVEVIFWVVLGLIYFGQFIFKKISAANENRALEEESNKTRRFNDPAQSGQPTYPQSNNQAPQKTYQPAQQKSPEDELRKFLEALGLPVDNTSSPTFPEQEHTFSPPPSPQPKPTQDVFPRLNPPTPASSPVPLEMDEEEYTDVELLPTVVSAANQSCFQTKIELKSADLMSTVDQSTHYMSQNETSNEAYALDAHAARRNKTISLNPLRKLLADPVKLKQAVIMREILGTPKGLEP